MPISRRLRFEILRRDGYTCRYCGAKAPDVTLSVDHVIPTALGGGDEPNNLVTACTPCNSGKTSLSPDSPIVEDVDAAALLWAKAMERAVQIRRQEIRDRGMQRAHFAGAWQMWHYGEGNEEQVPWPPNWEDSVERFLDLGLDINDLVEMVPVAMRSNVSTDSVWRYFCGIAWKEIARRQELARRLTEDQEV